MATTTVVNMRTHMFDVYIGREGHGYDGYWGNPYSVSRDGGREAAVALYKEYLYERLKTDAEFARRIRELKGKRLGCFCVPKKCHGEVIVEFLEQKMKVVVCGCRNWTSVDTIRKRLLALPCETTIVEGGCDGADLIAREVALDIELEVVEFPASWKKYGRAAGPKRNIRMLNTKPDLVIAFHNDLNTSKGTKHIVREARKRGIEVELLRER